jgi:SAM-dependent methyltransferase
VNERAFQFFLQFHKGIPRQGPGTPNATTEAFHRIEAMLPPVPSILDLGCGSGGQTLTLAGLTTGHILAVDINPVSLDALRQRLAERDLLSRVTAQAGDMTALTFAPETFDLIWCESAIFIPGFEAGLRALRPLLRGPGLMVVSEAIWLRPRSEVPADVLAFWDQAYPAMSDAEGTLALARRAGFSPVGHFALPEEGWAAYVDPLEKRMNEVLALNAGNPDAEEAARSERREFAMFRTNLAYFGYEFFLLRRDDAAGEG